MRINKQNKSFSRRVGKSLSLSQKAIVTECIKDIHEFSNITPLRMEDDLELSNLKNEELIKNFAINLSKQDNISLEIGFGMGEHLFSQTQANKQNFFLGSEPYLNGVASLKNKFIQNESKNCIIWPDDVNILLHHLPEKIFDNIYILFPDPWQKRKQISKRIVNEERLPIFRKLLKDNGMLHFATDISDYAKQVLKIVESTNIFHKVDKNSNDPHKDYVQTKYHSKALQELRTPEFYSFSPRI